MKYEICEAPPLSLALIHFFWAAFCVYIYVKFMIFKLVSQQFARGASGGLTLAPGGPSCCTAAEHSIMRPRKLLESQFVTLALALALSLAPALALALALALAHLPLAFQMSGRTRELGSGAGAGGSRIWDLSNFCHLPASGERQTTKGTANREIGVKTRGESRGENRGKQGKVCSLPSYIFPARVCGAYIIAPSLCRTGQVNEFSCGFSTFPCVCVVCAGLLPFDRSKTD